MLGKLTSLKHGHAVHRTIKDYLNHNNLGYELWYNARVTYYCVGTINDMGLDHDQNERIIKTINVIVYDIRVTNLSREGYCQPWPKICTLKPKS